MLLLSLALMPPLLLPALATIIVMEIAIQLLLYSFDPAYIEHIALQVLGRVDCVGCVDLYVV